MQRLLECLAVVLVSTSFSAAAAGTVAAGSIADTESCNAPGLGQPISLKLWEIGQGFDDIRHQRHAQDVESVSQHASGHVLPQQSSVEQQPNISASVLRVQEPVDLVAQSTDRVLISNIPELAQSLPAPIQLPEESRTAEPTPTFGVPLQIEKDARLVPQTRPLELSSAAALVVDQQQSRLLYAKNPYAVMSIASITKLMTAMVVLDGGLPLEELLTIDSADADSLKATRSRLKLGISLTRRDMLKLALMASENRAAATLARNYPGGFTGFVQAMNNKAKALGMRDTCFLDPTGLNPSNVSTAHDLALMVDAAYQYPLIREFTTSDSHRLRPMDSHYRTDVAFHNSNGLVRSSRWAIGLSKTGYINEAGRCLVMQATIAAKPVIIVLLDSWGKVSRAADANRIKHWLEGPDTPAPIRHGRRL